MKICPACQNQYTDNTLKFCLQDGTPLAFAREADTPTAVLNETETIAARGGERLQVPIDDPNAAAWQRSQVTHTAAAPQSSRSNTALIAVLGVIAVLAVLGLVGVGAWIFLRNSQNVVAVNTPYNLNAQPPPANSNLSSNPSPPVTSTRANITPLPANTPGTTSPPVDKSQVSSEVRQKISNWKSLTESKDMSGLRTSYAPVLDYYYNKRNVNSSSVIADKERAFRNYTSMRIDLSNITVTTDPSGENATAVYNKDWTFSGIKPFCGSIRSQMQFRKINSVWLIVGEKDVPGTFRRSC